MRDFEGPEVRRYRSAEFDRYLRQVTVNCPYLSRALASGQVENRYLFLENDDLYDVILAVAKQAYHESNRLLRDMIDRSIYSFGCVNIILEFASKFETDDHRNLVLSVVHWLMKDEFSNRGLVFGKFRVGQGGDDRQRRPIAISPVTFLSIRTGIKDVDERFLTDDPRHLKEFRASYRNDGPGHDIPIPSDRELRGYIDRIIHDAQAGYRRQLN